MSTATDPVQEVLAAFAASEAEPALRSAVQGFLTDGRTRTEVANLLEDARDRLTADQENEDELLLDTIAVLVGLASHTAQHNLIPPPCKLPAGVASVPS